MRSKSNSTSERKNKKTKNIVQTRITMTISPSYSSRHCHGGTAEFHGWTVLQTYLGLRKSSETSISFRERLMIPTRVHDESKKAHVDDDKNRVRGRARVERKQKKNKKENKKSA